MGETMTYARLAKLAEVSESMIRKLGSEADYHPTLEHVDVICDVLGVELTDLLERVPGAAPSATTHLVTGGKKKSGSSKRKKQ